MQHYRQLLHLETNISQISSKQTKNRNLKRPNQLFQFSSKPTSFLPNHFFFSSRKFKNGYTFRMDITKKNIFAPVAEMKIAFSEIKEKVKTENQIYDLSRFKEIMDWSFSDIVYGLLILLESNEKSKGRFIVENKYPHLVELWYKLGFCEKVKVPNRSYPILICPKLNTSIILDMIKDKF